MAVSVILKTLNEETRIGAAIESVLAALEGIGGEIIVADGGSRDRTLAVAANYPVRVVQLVAAIPPSCGIGPQLGPIRDAALLGAVCRPNAQPPPRHRRLARVRVGRCQRRRLLCRAAVFGAAASIHRGRAAGDPGRGWSSVR